MEWEYDIRMRQYVSSEGHVLTREEVEDTGLLPVWLPPVQAQAEQGHSRYNCVNCGAGRDSRICSYCTTHH